MEKIYAEVLSIVNAWLKDEPLPEISNYERLFALSKEHGVSNILYLLLNREKKRAGNQALPETVEGELFLKIKKQYQANLHQQISQEYFAEELFSKLRERRIRFMPLKGYFLKKYYPSSAGRTSCDVDVFYDDSKKQEAGEILKELGFELTVPSDHDDGWTRDSVTIEMHFSLMDHYDLYVDYYKNVWDRLVSEDGIEYAFTTEDFYIYFLMHVAKHFYHSGLGVRFILDLYLFRKAHLNLDETYLQKELEKLELATFRKKMEELANVWFGESEATEESEKIGAFVFECGLYGKEINQTFSVTNAGEDSVGEKTVKRKFILRSIFPSRDALKRQYPSLKKNPWLLPFVWAHRWFKVLFFKRDKIKYRMKLYRSLEDEKIQKRYAVMQAVGLKEEQKK